MSRILGFPNPVNEVAARTVAAGVAMLSVSTIVLASTLGHGWLWLSAPLAAGFVARVLTGPKLSPLGLFATRVVAPRIGPEKLVPGPPKRFAQAVGAAMTVVGVVLLALGFDPATFALLGLVAVAATLESVFAFCVGCTVFAGLMRLGMIPEETCAACADITLRHPRAA
ncbi:MAG TPA: DUF4395 domain-containing protein [Jatrophihabitans sp.]|nr:DUF4395 domain-containing protein [Jatrophihabitans sp.]